MKIHPTAVVSDDSRLGADAEIGPYAIIEEGAVIGDRCRVMAGAVIMSCVELGADVTVHPHVVLGGLPQDVSFKPSVRSGVRVGAGTVLREGVTVHRAKNEGVYTAIGSNCYLMAYSHVGHDCVVGDNVIMANNALLAGHVKVGDRVFISGNSGVHQWCRVGRVAMIGGLTRVNMDVPPFMTAVFSEVTGVNSVGMRRAGFDSAAIAAVRQVFRILYKSGLTHGEAYERILAEVRTPEAAEMVSFCKSASRGILKARGVLGESAE
jgi:UDP-N-acetylglucosamine acyltransferase